MQELLSKIFSINEIQIVGIYQDANVENYAVLRLKKNKDKLDIVARENSNKKEALIKFIDSKTPVVLNLDGKGVLNKKINFSNDDDLVWQKNIDYNSIFHTSYKTEKDLFISFCRKHVVEDWLAFFQENQIQVLDFYLGSFSASLLKSQLKQNTLFLNATELSFENDTLVGFKKNTTAFEENYSIHNDEFTSLSLPLYAAGLNFFIKSENISKSDLGENTLEEQLYKKAFNVFGVAILIGFFISLLLSYFGIQYYTAKNAELNIQNVYSNKAYQQITTLENQKQDKENIIRNVGLLSNKFLTFYDYELFQSVPKEVSLKNVDINPIRSEVKGNKKVEFSAGLIQLEGLTVNENVFNNWLKTIKGFEWVQKFEIESLKKDKKNNTQFSILIWTK